MRFTVYRLQFTVFGLQFSVHRLRLNIYDRNSASGIWHLASFILWHLASGILHPVSPTLIYQLKVKCGVRIRKIQLGTFAITIDGNVKQVDLII